MDASKAKIFRLLNQTVFISVRLRVIFVPRDTFYLLEDYVLKSQYPNDCPVPDFP